MAGYINGVREACKRTHVEGIIDGWGRALEIISRTTRDDNQAKTRIRGPIKVTSMGFQIDPSKHSVNVKVRKHPAVQKTFLAKYLSRLSALGFIKPCPQASWGAAPHLVHKSSMSLFCTTVDLRLVNAAI